MGDLVDIKKNLPANLASAFDANDLAGDLYDNVSGGFPVFSFRGSKWRIKHGGEETLLTNDDGDPVPSLECVIVKASKQVGKTFYAKDYEEGSDQSPDCWSMDGQTPDPAVEHKQAETCAVCPHNQWGSKITPAGKKGKRCGDSRRLAVVPLGDIANEEMGGPVLLRVPAASLADLAKYGKGMAAKGFPYNAIGTRIGFDPQPAYPKLTFKPIRKLTQEELEAVAEHFHSDALATVLDVPAEMMQASTPEPAPASEPPQEAVSLDFEEEGEEEAPPPRKKVAAKKKVAKKKVAAKAPPKANGADEDADDLDDLIGDLDSLA